MVQNLHNNCGEDIEMSACKTVKNSIIALLMGIAASIGFMVQSSQAEPQSRSGSLNELMQRVNRDTAKANSENQKRIQKFQSSRNEQVSILNKTKSELNALSQRSIALDKQFQDNEQKVKDLESELKARSGEFGELFGVARQKAAEMSSVYNKSIISTEYTGRADALKELSESRTLPTKTELDQIWEFALQEMIAQGEVKTFQKSVINRNEGNPIDITRIGAFLAFISDNQIEFLKWIEDKEKNGTNILVPLDRQPSSEYIKAAKSVAKTSSDKLVAGPVDPSRGQLLEVLKDVPNRYERIQQGGVIGNIIIILAIIGILLGIWRLLVLFFVQSSVNRQKRTSQISKSNPLGRVMSVYEDSKNADEATIELKLDESILQETPKLERGLNLLKLLAGVAPLLGLLGTVTGMILTFDMITLFGTGDPKLMAGGISQALITTVLGLVAAIPLLFLHSFCSGFSRNVQAVLEEQAAGLVARHSEGAK